MTRCPPSAKWRSTRSGVRCAQVCAGATWAAPMSAHAAALWTRPLLRAAGPPAPAPLDWRQAGSKVLLHHECGAPPDHIYR